MHQPRILLSRSTPREFLTRSSARKTSSRGLTLVAVFGIFSMLLGIGAQAAVRTWSGGGTSGFWTNSANWDGTAPLPGDDLVFPSGALNLSNTNNFPAGTTFNSITISGGNYGLAGSNITLSAGINATNTTLQNYFSIPITLNSNQTIITGNASVNLYLNGDIDLNGKQLTFAGNGFAQTQSYIKGAGGLVKTGTGTVQLYSSNTFSGPVQILQGGISAYNGNALGDTNGSTVVSNGATLSLINAFTVPEPLILSGTLNVATGAKLLTGPISLADSNVTVQVGSGSSLVVDAVIAGSGGFTKTGAGDLTLSSNNTYTGSTTLNGGTLLINGSQPQTAVIVNSGTLGGAGTVGSISCVVSGTLHKFLNPGGSPGILTCSNVVLDSQTTFDVELNGPSPGSGYDQLNVYGSVTLNNAALSVTLGYTPSFGDCFVFVNNDGSDSVNGTFAGLPEGGFVTNGAIVLQISYGGGDGNDVVLTRAAPPPLTIGLAIEPLPNSAVRLVWPTNPPGFNLEFNTNLTTTNWLSASPSPTVVGTNNFVTNSANQPQQFYRLYKP